jgi:N-methylhydantoinase A
MGLDATAAEHAIRTHVAEPLELDLATAAEGITAIATASMANAVRAVTTERGLDPRDFALVAYGGAGPLHAVDVARELAIDTVIIPPAPGTFSAFGMLTADLRREYARTYRVRLTAEGLGETEPIFAEIEAEATAWLRSAGIPSADTTLERSLDIRYVGQNYAVTIRLPFNSTQEEVKRTFDAVHEQRYSHSAPEEPAEIIATRISIIGALSRPQLEELASGTGSPSPNAVIGRRTVRFAASGDAEAVIFNRHELLAGDVFAGPAVVQEDGSATVVPADVLVCVLSTGHLQLTVNP